MKVSRGIAGLALSAGALLLHIIAIATKYWMTLKLDIGRLKASYYVGLWKYCKCDPECQCGPTKDTTGDHELAARACMVIALLGIAATMLTMIVQLCVKEHPTVLRSRVVAAVAAAGFTFAGVIVVAAWKPQLIEQRVPEFLQKTAKDMADFGYSFVLCIISGLLMAAVSALSIHELVKGPRHTSGTAQSGGP